MVDKFKVALYRLVSKEKRLLVAVSGGLDSVALCHLCHRAGVDFGMAHCNYHLRGAESDGDEVFVRELAEALGVPFHLKHFHIETGNIQAEARAMRYAWLEEMREAGGYNHIATGHHVNDSIETALFNFSKGTGIRGLRGILPRKGRVVRPLLGMSRADLEGLAAEWGLVWREDSSNEGDKYSRNKIRHHVVPVLQTLNPNLTGAATRTFRNLRESELLLDYFINEVKGQVVREEKGVFYLNKAALAKYPALRTLLFGLLNADFGFNSEQVENIMEVMYGGAGRQFFSASHRLVVDRTDLIVHRLKEDLKNEIIINKQDEKISLSNGDYLEFRIGKMPVAFQKDARFAYLDASKIRYPFRLRRWRAGDAFQPFGMQGRRKKIKDFFSDLKLSILQKEQIWILESDDRICWVVGLRSDERFRIGEDCEEVLIVEYSEARP